MKSALWIITSLWMIHSTTAGQPQIIAYAPEADEPSHMRDTGNQVVSFSALAAEEVPENWQLDGGDTSLKIVRDPALDGGAYLRIEGTGVKPALLRLPVRSDGEGRMMVRMRARSPQAKWWQLAAVAGDQTLWQHNLPLSSSWQNGAWEFQTHRDGVAELRMEFSGPGIVELEFLEIEVLDTESLRTVALARHGGRAPGNLLRNSRLPLGLQAGWNLDRHHDDGVEPVMVPEDAMQGTDGWPALRVTSEAGLRFCSEPFAPALPGGKHMASMSVRGEGAVSVRILQDAVPLEEVLEFTGSEDWTRLELLFPTTTSAKNYALQIDAKGTIWFDKFQVHDGAKARDYSSAGQCEVALAVLRPSRVMFDNEPATVNWAVTGAPEGAQLHGKVVNLYGGQAVLKPVPLDAAAIIRGEIDAAVFPGEPLGTLRLEMWVTDEEGQRISPYNEIVLHRVRRPRHEGAFAPDSPFGIHTFPTTRHIEMARAIGITWVRLHDAGGLEWFHLEPKRGEWKFRDDVVKRFRDEKFEILGLFSTSPCGPMHGRMTTNH